MRASLSTSVRAVNQTTPYLGCDETRSSTATAARPLSRPCSQLSYCGWKTENVLSPLASCRGHGSTSTSEAAGASPKADVPDVHPARPGNTSSMKRSANSARRFHRSKRFVICLLFQPVPVSGSARCSPISVLIHFEKAGGRGEGQPAKFSQECARRAIGHFRVLAETG